MSTTPLLSLHLLKHPAVLMRISGFTIGKEANPVINSNYNDFRLSHHPGLSNLINLIVPGPSHFLLVAWTLEVWPARKEGACPSSNLTYRFLEGRVLIPGAYIYFCLCCVREILSSLYLEECCIWRSAVFISLNKPGVYFGIVSW